MRHKTYQFFEETWIWLDKNKELHTFESKNQWMEFAKCLGEVEGDGSAAYITRKNEDEPFSVNNTRLVNIACPDDWNLVIHPAFSQGGNNA